MSERPKKPAMFAGHEFGAFMGGDDPAVVSAVAHDIARVLVERVREDTHGEALCRAMSYVDEHGVEDLAQLWSASSARSLPGALWRIYLVRDFVSRQPSLVSSLYVRGAAQLHTVDPVIAGAPNPVGPEEIVTLSNDILAGVFLGDFADALDRAAAFCRVVAAGCLSVANDSDESSLRHNVRDASSSSRAHAEAALALTQQASRLTHTATELATCARLYRRGSLE